MNQEEKYYNWLYHVPGVGRKTLKKLAEGTKDVACVCQMKPGELSKYLTETCGLAMGTAEKMALAIYNRKEVCTPENLKNKIEQRGINYSLHKSLFYPQKLREIPDAPFGLYSKGMDEVRIQFAKGISTVAIIGARECSEYGKNVARLLGKKCAEYKLGLVSGMAMGVDAIAQRACLVAGGSVAAVLGCGVDIAYPNSALKLYEDLCRNGCVYSEYIPGTEPKANYFPPRNRIISGMADALVVVEARERSGTMITVDMALEQGRSVYIVPGRLTDPMSVGCNRLIKQGAEIVCDPDELFEEIIQKDTFGSFGGTEEGEAKEREKILPKETGTLRKPNPYPAGNIRYYIYQALEIGPATVQYIYERIPREEGVDISKVSQEILYMQMDGTVSQSAGMFGLVAEK